ncbi:nuclear factor 7, brain-like [Rhinophrynus dorsalis]
MDKDVRKHQETMQQTPLFLDIKRQLRNMNKKSLELVGDFHIKMAALKKDSTFYRERMCKSFDDVFCLLEKEREMRLAKNKEKEEKVMKHLETGVMNLGDLTYSITDIIGTLDWKEVILQTREEVRLLRAQLEAIGRFEANLDGCFSPLQLRQWRGMRHFVKPVPEVLQFDPLSAHPNLILSPDLRQVRFESYPWMLKGSKNCFEPMLYVLASPGFHSGRHYWEVDVGNKSSWIIGIVRESVNRKGQWDLCSENGYWVIRKQEDNVYYGIGNSVFSLKLDASPVRIGVCLDLFRGHLSFYDADTTSLIFELSFSVKEKMFAFFSPGVPVRQEDWCPMTLCA